MGDYKGQELRLGLWNLTVLKCRLKCGSLAQGGNDSQEQRLLGAKLRILVTNKV